MACGDHKAMIGCVTIIIGDLASLLGCAMQATFDSMEMISSCGDVGGCPPKKPRNEVSDQSLLIHLYDGNLIEPSWNPLVVQYLGKAHHHRRHHERCTNA